MELSAYVDHMMCLKLASSPGTSPFPAFHAVLHAEKLGIGLHGDEPMSTVIVFMALRGLIKFFTMYVFSIMQQSSSKPKKSSSTINPETSDKQKTPSETDKRVQVDDETSPNETATEQSTKDSEEHKTEE